MSSNHNLNPQAAPLHLCRIEPGGWTVDAMPDVPLLEAAEAAGIDMPSSCRNGTCRTCLAHLQSGEVHYLVEWPGLSAEEKAEGCVLPCVACAASDVVLVAPLAKNPWG